MIITKIKEKTIDMMLELSKWKFGDWVALAFGLLVLASLIGDLVYRG